MRKRACPQMRDCPGCSFCMVMTGKDTVPAFQCVIKFSLSTGKSKAHAVRCPHSYDTPGFVTAIVGGANLADCIEKFSRDEHLKARGFPAPVACGCLTTKV